MPSALLYLGIMLVVICVWFIWLKRPVYEAVLISFALLLTLTGTWGNIGTYIDKALSTSLLYSMTAFVAMSIILTKTKVIDGCVAIILSLLGKIPGGAGYASVIASSFMGALSGSGPGNVMATGSITIPAMKKSGFPAELAANVESNSSYLGNMIPPSSNIVAALGAFTALYPDANMTTGQFWVVLWGISLWFILQKLLIVWGFCKYYKVQPMADEDIPQLKEVLKDNWQGMLLPVIILVPFVLDYFFKSTFFTARLGADGAKYMSSSLLLFIAGLSAMYACFISKDRDIVSPKNIAKMFGDSIKTISPAIGVCIIGYMIGGLFTDLNVAADMEMFIVSMNFNRFGMVTFICLLTCFLGMVIPGSSLVVIFGPVFISTLATVGVNPLLAAAMLPCICGVMCGITPPLALGLYAGMSLAESDFGKTVKNDLWWVAFHFILEVIVLMEILPIFGL
ncbi:MAG: TRAP transporter large permease subunit [Anaerofustis stercorihominis]|nr:TRAP transporter large permease subunit [Anaerofustis stercorihominis]